MSVEWSRFPLTDPTGWLAIEWDGEIAAEVSDHMIEVLPPLVDARSEADRYKEAFAMLVNEIGEHVTWLRDWETDPDMSPHRAAAELESVIDDIEREQGIDDVGGDR